MAPSSGSMLQSTQNPRDLPRERRPKSTSIPSDPKRAVYIHPEDGHGRLEDARARLEDVRARLEDACVRLEDACVRLEDARVRLEDARVRLEDARVRLEDARVRLEDTRACLEDASLRYAPVFRLFAAKSNPTRGPRSRRRGRRRGIRGPLLKTGRWRRQGNVRRWRGRRRCPWACRR